MTIPSVTIDAMQQKTPKSNFCYLCGAWKGQLGLEPTFDLYISHLCDIFDKVKRVLKKEGSIWVNMGDTYWGGGQGGTDYGGKETTPECAYGKIAKGNNYQSKSLCCIPDHFKIEMINRGWILRNTIIWHKPNPMPSSAKDRFTVDFEYLFMFVKSNKSLYWTNEKTLELVTKQPLGTKGKEGVDWEWKELIQLSSGLTLKDFDTEWEYRQYIRVGKEYNSKEPYKENMPGCIKPKRKKVSLWTGHDYYFEQQFEENKEPWRGKGEPEKLRSRKEKPNDKKVKYFDFDKRLYNPQGRNMRCVWTIPTMPCSEAHFAVFPEKLLMTPIKAGCPEFICKKCSKARVKTLNIVRDEETQTLSTEFRDDGSSRNFGGMRWKSHPEFKGYTDCNCNAGFEGGIVLDPFAGRGTTGIVAQKLGRRYILIDLSEEYCKLAERNLAQEWLM